jgi:geranylgeranyl diphosphate synthase type I
LVTGKPAGDDLREGKRTVLVARAVARAQDDGDTDTLDVLARVLGDKQASAQGIAEAAAAIESTGAVDDVEALIAELSRHAMAVFEAAAWPSPEGDTLRDLARSAVERHA